MFVRLLAGTTLLLAATPAAAQTWRVMGFTGDGASLRLLYIDQDSITKPTPDTREFTLAQVYPTQQKLADGKPYDWLQIRFSLDCRTIFARSIETSVHVTGAVVMTTKTPGRPAPFATSNANALAASAACRGDFKLHYQSQSSAMMEGSRVRFGRRAAVIKSRSSISWYRLGMADAAPKRSALLVDRESLSAPDMYGRRELTVATVLETPNDGTKYFLQRGKLICDRTQRLSTYSELYRADGTFESAFFPNSDPVVIQPGSVFHTLFAPVCKGDWNKARAFPQLQIVKVSANAFLP